MNLVIEIETVMGSSGGQAAYGFVVTDADSARAIHEAAHLAEASDPLLVNYEALMRVVDLLIDERPEQAEIRCTSREMIEQITGGGPAQSGGEAERAYESVMMRLLKLDSWSLVPHDRGHSRRATQLAQHALEAGGDVVSLEIDDAAVQQKQRHTGVPQWTVELLDDAGERCPARCKAEVRFPFGPDTPAGFCVYAAAVALADGPMAWSDPQQQRMTTVCPHCDVPMRIVRVG